MNRATLLRKLTIAAGAAVLGLGIGRAGALAAARMLNPGDCFVADAAFTNSTGGCTDVASGLTYSASYLRLTGQNLSQPSAVAYCDGLDEGGWTDWRVPTLYELRGLGADGGADHLAMDGPYGYVRWSSTTQGNRAYGIVIGTGYTSLSLKTSGFDVICVRPTVAPPKKGK